MNKTLRIEILDVKNPNIVLDIEEVEILPEIGDKRLIRGKEYELIRITKLSSYSINYRILANEL